MKLQQILKAAAGLKTSSQVVISTSSGFYHIENVEVVGKLIILHGRKENAIQTNTTD